MIVNMFPINVFTVYHSTVVTLCFRIYNVYALLHGIGMNQSDGKLLVYNGTSLFWTSLHGTPESSCYVLGCPKIQKYPHFRGLE